ncbi:MAG: FtsX-like permease family protein [Planctomycetota bacterium]|nr:FtsX-like permease family protein [Planctomycetota bacterium]
MPDTAAAAIGQLPQVEVVMPVRLVMSECKATADLVAVYGIDKESFQRFRAFDVDAAAVEDFKADKSGALMGVEMARRFGYKVGEYVTLPKLEGVSFTVRGIYTTGGTVYDNVVLVGRRFLQECVDAQGISSQFQVKVKDGVNPEQVAAEIDTLPATVKTRTLSEKAFMGSAFEDLAGMMEYARIVAVATLLVLLVAIGNTISMATRDRIREIAVLRTLGFTRRSIMGTVLAESFTISVIGGAVGLLIAWLAFTFGRFVIAVCGMSIRFALAPEMIFLVAVVIGALGLAGGLVPAIASSRRNVAHSLRHVD